MPVRDVLWACPLCRTAGGIRAATGGERCSGCGARFRRGRGARIVARSGGARDDRPTGDWLREIGPPIPPDPGPDGRILGPESVRVKFARRQAPLHWAGHMLGWVELYESARRGRLSLHAEGLTLELDDGRVHWRPDQVTGLQPASSSIQLRVGREMASFKFLEGSVRLWTAALVRMLRAHHQSCGYEVLELQPCLRLRPAEPR